MGNKNGVKYKLKRKTTCFSNVTPHFHSGHWGINPPHPNRIGDIGMEHWVIIG